MVEFLLSFFFLNIRSLAFISYFTLLFIHGGLSGLMYSCGDMGLYSFIHDCFKFIPKDTSGQGVSVGVDIFSSHVEYPFYVPPVGFPIYGHITFVGAYIYFSENDIAVLLINVGLFIAIRSKTLSPLVGWSTTWVKP